MILPHPVSSEGVNESVQLATVLVTLRYVTLCLLKAFRVKKGGGHVGLRNYEFLECLPTEGSSWLGGWEEGWVAPRQVNSYTGLLPPGVRLTNKRNIFVIVSPSALIMREANGVLI